MCPKPLYTVCLENVVPVAEESIRDRSDAALRLFLLAVTAIYRSSFVVVTRGRPVLYDICPKQDLKNRLKMYSVLMTGVKIRPQKVAQKVGRKRIKTSRVARDKPWSTLCKKSHGIPSSPRAAAVAKFRLLTGHDCLCAHLFRFNLVTSPICVLCDTGQDMTAAHLDECSALNDLNCIVKRYWRARCLMT
ncbi:uncharacterized protein TNCV_4214271 [Trichonephila clavipes]|nr:uncharacterized protein TNCV_4214271 [Trichonephila clavipes]